MKHAVVIVHGMGSQKKTKVVEGFTEETIVLIQARGDASKSPTSVSVPDYEGNSAAQIQYGADEWKFIEYHWAEEFTKPSVIKTYSWISSQLMAHYKSMEKGLQRSKEDKRPDSDGNQDVAVSRRYQRVASLLYLWLIRIFRRISYPVILFLMVMAFGARSKMPVIAQFIIKRLDGFAVGYLGDIYMYFEDAIQAAKIRSGLTELLHKLGDDTDIDKVIVVAHSTGAVIAYESITDINDDVGNSSAQNIKDKLETLITFGAILNMSWNEGIVEHGRFKNDLPNDLHWYNLWTRYDYGAAGDINAGRHAWLDEDILADYRASNLGSPARDHTSYWENREQLHALVLEELGGRENANDFWRGEATFANAKWWNRSDQTWKDFSLRRRAVGKLGMSRLPLMFAILLCSPLVVAWGIFTGVSQLASSLDWYELSYWTALYWSIVPIIVILGLCAVGHYGYEFLFWRRWFRTARNTRDQAFLKWREDGRPNSS